MRELFEKSVKPVFIRLRGAVRDVLFERRMGIESEAEIQLDELGVAGEHRSHYKPSEWLTLRRILPRREVSPDDVFVDFGSGMGRVVVQAAMQYPFRRVVGVEISEQLHEVAQRNVERTRARFHGEVQLVAGDVREFPIPDDVTVAYFANPFTGPIFHQVIDRLLASFDQHPRPLRIIYRNPVEHDYLLATGRVRPARQLRGWRPGEQWSRENATRMYVVLADGH